METTTIRKKVHQDIDEADNAVLEIVYKLLAENRLNNESALSTEQQTIVEETSVLYKTGKMKSYSEEHVKKVIKKRLTKEFV